MKEELKRELEDLKESAPERTEELLKDLREESKSEPSPQKSYRKSFKFYLILFGIVMSLLGLFGGGLFIWKLLKGSKQEVSLDGKDSKNMVKDKEGVRDSNETPEVAKVESQKIEIPRSISGQEQALRLKLPNFLISIDERNFVKMDVYLLYSDKDRYLEAQKREFELRAFLYGELRKVKGEFFRSEAKMKELEEALAKALRQRHPQFSPDRIELEGLILKT